jgi:hypothetical protein
MKSGVLIVCFAVVATACGTRETENDWPLYSISGKPWGYREYLARWPHGRHAAEATAALALPVVDVLDAVNDGKVEARASYSRENTMYINLKPTSAEGVAVHVAPGIVFRSRDASYEDMIGLSVDTIILVDTTGRALRVTALSTSLRRERPKVGAAIFAIERASPNVELRKLVPFLSDTRGRSDATRQAAIWIVTDDASYDDLGVLKSVTLEGPARRETSRSRAIGTRAATAAMMDCANAGIDITGKRIWWDRDSIAAAFEERRGESDTLKSWLETYGRRP